MFMCLLGRSWRDRKSNVKKKMCEFSSHVNSIILVLRFLMKGVFFQIFEEYSPKKKWSQVII